MEATLTPKPKPSSAEEIGKTRRTKNADDIMAVGQRLYEREYDRTGTPEEVVWFLMEEAARTERSIVAAGPRHQSIHGVDYFHTRAEIWGTEVEMALDQITYDPSIRTQPTASEYQRFMVVFLWLRHVGTSKPDRTRKILWKLAHGIPSQKLADQYGYGSRQGVLALKYRAVNNITEHLAAC